MNDEGHLEEETLFLGHARVVEPLVLLRVPERVVLTGAVREDEFVQERIRRVDGSLVAHGEGLLHHWCLVCGEARMSGR